jgi:prevent-host-death family protein
MLITNVSSAKTNLSALIERVQQGETVLILHRGRPVARLGPVGGARHDTDGERLNGLEAAGVIRRGLEPPDPDLFASRPAIESPGEGLLAALLADREEGR